MILTLVLVVKNHIKFEIVNKVDSYILKIFDLKKEFVYIFS